MGSTRQLQTNYMPNNIFQNANCMVADAIQRHLVENKFFPHEQEGNHLNSRGTKNQLLICNDSRKMQEKERI